MGKQYAELPVNQMLTGDDVIGFFLLNNANVKTSTNGSQFLAGKIGDKDAEIDFKIWDYNSDLHENVGSVIKVCGTVTEYNGVKQIVVDRARLAQSGDPYNLANLVPCAPIDIDATYHNLQSILNNIQDNVYRAIALAMLDRMGEDMKRIPAAKSMHHAFLAGLLMHTYNIIQMALATADIYGSTVDSDLLVCGAFCHDTSKRKEYIISDIGLVKDYSVRGNLLGHLVMGAQEIADIAKELGFDENCEQVLLLQHLLLSHHGEPEYGACVVPKVLEAQILHLLDMLDAKVEMYRELLADMEPGTMSDNIRGMGHGIYKPTGV